MGAYKSPKGSLSEAWRESFGEEYQNWHRWFAWRPVKVDGKWAWFKMTYRRYSHTFGDYGWSLWNCWEYGTLLDILKEE